MKILNRWTNACIFESDHATQKETIIAAVNGAADLRYANLGGANLGYAIIAGCALGTSSFAEYLDQVVPTLLIAGGMTLRAILDSGAWDCNSWDNCPMAVAFHVHNLGAIPALHRPRAAQFVSLFDSGQIPREVVERAIAKADAQLQPNV